LTSSPYESASDDDLLARARGGDADGFGELWRRHSDAARRAAWQFRSIAEPDDLVSEAYARILDAVRRGHGPRGAFRPYLFVTIRNLVNRMSHAPATQQVDDFDEFVSEDTLEDPTIQALDRSLTVSAFRSLPERWQTVLWYTEVEDMTPAEVAPLLGLSANSTAALAYRARAGLREAWLQAHVEDEATSPECRWFLARAGSYTAGSLSARDARRARDHVSGCERCAVIADEVDDVGSRLALVLIPLLLGPAAGSAYLASQSAGSAAAASSASGSVPAGSSVQGGASAPAGCSVSAGASVPPSSAAGASGVSAAPAATAAVIGGTLAAKIVPAGIAVLAASAIVVGTVVATQQPWPPAATGASSSPRGTQEIVDAAPPQSAVPETPAPEQEDETPPPLLIHPVPVVPPGSGAGPRGGGAGGSGVGGTAPGGPGVGDPGTDPDPDPDGTGPGDTDPGDTEALAPVVTSEIANDQMERPELRGTAEPGSAITVTDQDGVVLAEVTADEAGDWTTGLLTELAASTTQFFVGQTDQAGNVSPLTTLGPFAFRPVIVSPVAEATCQFDSPAQFELAGWSGEPVLYYFTSDGQAADGFLAGHLDPDGALTFQLGCDTSAATEITLGFYYAGSEPETGTSITVQLLP
jgi:RNA polymerase sigma factor (sigma-70 family)